MRTVAIIQARMGSSRLPGKVLKPLVGKPVLWHIVHRLRKARRVDAVALATSDHPADDPLVAFASQEGIPVIRGPEENVLERFWLAAQQLGADVILRVTGDAPLVDPEMVDYLVASLLKEGADYCIVAPGTPCIHEGFSPFTFKALRRLVVEAGKDPVAREHVTAYFKLHPDFVPVAWVDLDPAYQFAGARISVDTPADFRFLETVYARLGAPPGEADVREVVKLLRREPDLLEINTHVQQKSITDPECRLLFRCDGDEELGLGHVVRCLALADELRDRHGCGIIFTMARGSIGMEMVDRAGYPLKRLPVEAEAETLESMIEELRPDGLVLDVRSALPAEKVARWRQETGLLTVSLDDPTDRRLAVDLAFYPPVPQVQAMNWEGFCGERYVGWEWVVLRREFRTPPPVPSAQERPLVLVTMGGSDPAALTLKAVRALDRLDEDSDAVVILGPGFAHDQELEVLLAGTRRPFAVYRDVANMTKWMSRATLAIASFGVTAYELAATRVPAIYLCLTADHAASAKAFAEAGMAINLGVHEEVSQAELADAVRTLLHDPAARDRMAERAQAQVDGRGAERVAQVIADALRTRKRRHDGRSL